MTDKNVAVLENQILTVVVHLLSFDLPELVALGNREGHSCRSHASFTDDIRFATASLLDHAVLTARTKERMGKR